MNHAKVRMEPQGLALLKDLAGERLTVTTSHSVFPLWPPRKSDDPWRATLSLSLNSCSHCLGMVLLPEHTAGCWSLSMLLFMCTSSLFRDSLCWSGVIYEADSAPAFSHSVSTELRRAWQSSPNHSGLPCHLLTLYLSTLILGRKWQHNFRPVTRTPENHRR